MKLYQMMSAFAAWRNSLLDKDDLSLDDTVNDIETTLDTLTKNHMPSGSGFDSGTEYVAGDEYKLVFYTSFHHMNDCGYYTNWTKHKIIVKATLSNGGFKVIVTGRNQNDIKDYIAEIVDAAMNTEINGSLESNKISNETERQMNS